jgi:hypothetical protein
MFSGSTEVLFKKSNRYSSVCNPEEPCGYSHGVVYTHVGVRLVLQWPWEAYHQNHNCLGFVADVCQCHYDHAWHQLGAVEL